jgi:protein FAM32A
MSDYDLRPGGSLKLKGAVIEGGIVKKYVFRARLSADARLTFPEKRRNPSAGQNRMSP